MPNDEITYSVGTVGTPPWAAVPCHVGSHCEQTNPPHQHDDSEAVALVTLRNGGQELLWACVTD